MMIWIAIGAAVCYGVGFFHGFYQGVVHGAPAWREWALERKRMREQRQ